VELQMRGEIQRNSKWMGEMLTRSTCCRSLSSQTRSMHKFNELNMLQYPYSILTVSLKYP
jgi:hypothetical protein